MALIKSFRNLERVVVTVPSELETAEIVWARSRLYSQLPDTSGPTFACGASHGVQLKRQKEDRSDAVRDNSGRLEDVYQERKHRVGRLHKVTHLTAKK